MKITCSCGASLEVDDKDINRDNRAQEFHAAHAVCRAKTVADIPAFAKRQCTACLQWVFGDNHECPALRADAVPAAAPIREAYIPGLGTVRACIDCGNLVSGGPTRCTRCADDVKKANLFDANPWRDAKRYMQLIMAVERVFPNETRHDTALRYIKEAEDSAKSGPCVTEVHHSCPP